jgi:hypothetical protein
VRGVILATVEHSGTRQVAIDLNLRSDQIVHLTDAAMPALLAYDGPIYTTERDVEQIRATWLRKRKDMDELAKQLSNFDRIKAHGANVIRLGRNRWRS